MLWSENRSDYRTVFYDTWKKMQNAEPLEPLQEQVKTVIVMHPEYHYVLNNKDEYFDKDYSPDMGEVNPFLHFSFHMILLEQLTKDDPKGIRNLYQKLCHQYGDTHEADHLIMNEIVQEVQTIMETKKPFNSKQYLKRIKKMINVS